MKLTREQELSAVWGGRKTLGGEPKGGLPGDHVCISGDPHGGME